MALNFVLENYFKDVLSFWWIRTLTFVIRFWIVGFFHLIFFYGLFRLNRLLLPMILGRYTLTFSSLLRKWKKLKSSIYYAWNFTFIYL